MGSKGNNATVSKKNSRKKAYDHKSIELKWQSNWQKKKVYQPNINTAKSSNKRKEPFYNLMMFPYPSAEGLHVGSVYAFGGADVFGRFKRMQGYDVFEPIGLDGFGIHSENHAIKTNTHPVDHAKRTEKNFYKQLHSIGNSFAWDNKLETYSPQYYKWTQWLFVQLFKSGLAYRKNSSVNYCPFCKTVLSDEQVIDGKCERCGTVVEKKDLEQWFFRITNYAERLLQNIESLDWTEKVKTAQRNWIGKSEGALIQFKVQSSKFKVEVFTTRPDTLHGATFMVISPEHPLVEEILSGVIPANAGISQILRGGQEREAKSMDSRSTSSESESKSKTWSASRNDIKKYVEEAKAKSDIERQAEGKEKTGVFSGLYAINPVTKEEIPVWIADYVLMGYGTGAIMAVPAHDQRDFEFAKKYGLPIKEVIESAEAKERKGASGAYTGPGFLVNSGEWDGLQVPGEIGKVIDWIEEKGIGKREKNYHLRDWLISRQRYWGPPIPMIYCEKCADEGKSWFTTEEGIKYAESGIRNQEPGERNHNSLFMIHNSREMVGWYPVPEGQLPVELPYVEDFKPMGTGKSPLANYPEFYQTKCPHCGADAKRETDVSDTFLDSAWYFLRYPSVDYADGAFDPEITKKWLPVNMYIGGAEHSVLHLLYARFVTMALHDMGYLDFEEPFTRFYAHGLIIKDGAKMSKSKGNVINPDDYIRKYGADALRCYLYFMGPLSQGGDFRDSGIEGMYKFLKRVWNLFESADVQERKAQSAEALRMLHKTVKKVTEELEHLRYNTAIASLMEWYNFLVKQESISLEEVETYLKLLAPFAPYMTEELYQEVKGERGDLRSVSIHVQPWPQYDEQYLIQDVVTIAVQVNGKLRGTVAVSATDIENQALVEAMARKDEGVMKFLTGEVKKVIYVPGKVLNFVVA